MDKTRSIQSSLLRSRWFPVSVVALTLAIFGATVVLARLHFQQRIQEQLVARDGETLHAIILMLQLNDPDILIGDPGDQFDLILRASQLKGVMGVRLFSPEGDFVAALPAHVTEEADIEPPQLAELAALRPVSRLHPKLALDSMFLLPPDEGRRTVPLLEVNVPLHAPGSGGFSGVAQFLIEGHSLADEFASLEANLKWLAGVTFLIGSAILLVVIGCALRFLQRQAGDLIRANRQLALAARCSAVGAISAHLIHGLKNPLAGLQMFVTNRSSVENGDTRHWEMAAASASRMESLINEVVAVLREEETAGQYELTLEDLAEVISDRTRSVAQGKGVELAVQTEGARTIPGRTANLVLLILANLLQNAVEATPGGRSVRLLIRADAEQLEFKVRDEGPGMPPETAANLFTPSCSSKKGGSGIGLAISKQLAAYIGATLDLSDNSGAGCEFTLVLPCLRIHEHVSRSDTGSVA